VRRRPATSPSARLEHSGRGQDGAERYGVGLLAIAALASTISLFEVLVSHLVDERDMTRIRACLMSAGALALAGTPAALSGGTRMFGSGPVCHLRPLRWPARTGSISSITGAATGCCRSAAWESRCFWHGTSVRRLARRRSDRAVGSAGCIGAGSGFCVIWSRQLCGSLPASGPLYLMVTRSRSTLMSAWATHELSFAFVSRFSICLRVCPYQRQIHLSDRRASPGDTTCNRKL
jgi:hypothetical protein